MKLVRTNMINGEFHLILKKTTKKTDETQVFIYLKSLH